MTREEFELLKKEKFFKSTVVSDSMVPILKEGDRVIVETNVQNLKRFDIIVIYLNGKLICHYLWRMNKFVTPIIVQTRNMKGQVDTPVQLSDCLGKVVSHRIDFLTKLRFLIFSNLLRPSDF